MRHLLITGFDPFGGSDINPAWEAVRLLPEQIGSFRLHKLQIPTRFREAARQVLEEADRCRPDVILCIGQAGGRAAVTPERVAINLRDARIPDNGGCQPLEEPIDPSGPAAYFATVPVGKMAAAISDRGLPGAVSNTAGTFVCNETLYLLLQHYDQTPVRAGFIHVPFLPEQGTPHLSLEQTISALTAAIEAL